ncbi:MAG: hypothetical protein ACO1QR_16905 [Chthoniobacteraceae bacterium]
MIHVTPQQFSDAFLHAATVAQVECLALWDARRDFTAHMLRVVLPAIAPHLQVQVYPWDYYTLDCVYFAERDTEHFGETSNYAKCLSIALEHENDIRGTAVEMNKLQLFNAPLKVLITYAGSEVQRRMYLERYSRIVQSADVFGDFAALRKQLVIFGDRDDCSVNWKFYVYEGSGFHELRISSRVERLECVAE